MKRWALSAILSAAGAILMLTGCSGNRNDLGDMYHFGTDYPYFFHEQANRMHISAAEQGYYFLNGNYIYYADRSDLNPVLLDNRPDSDCLNASGERPQNCSAYVHTEMLTGFLQYYDGKLYVLESETVYGNSGELLRRAQLLEISGDGSTRKRVMSFDFPPKGIAIHRGVLYYSTEDFGRDSDYAYGAMQIPLNDPFAKPTPIYQGDLKLGQIQDIIPYGNHVYMLEIAENTYRTLRYDIKEKKTYVIFTDRPGEHAAIQGIFDDRLIFGYFYGDPKDERSHVIYATDLKGEHIERLPIYRTFINNVYPSGEYLFVRPVWFYLRDDEFKHIPHELTVYDRQYREVDRIDLSFLPVYHHLSAGDEHFMFARVGGEGIQDLYVLDKKEIGTGRASFKPMIRGLNGEAPTPEGAESPS